MSALPYGWLLAAYPRAYRKEHGAEILATLAEACRPGRRIPPLREVLALIRGGAVARVRGTAAGPVPWWADGIHLGVFVIALAICAPGAANVLDAAAGLTTHFGFNYSPWWYPWEDLLPMLAALALMRGWVWPALASAALTVLEILYFDGPTISRLPLTVINVLYFSRALETTLVFAGLLVLAARQIRPRRATRLRHRSWCWWLIVLLEVVGYEGRGHGWLQNTRFWPGSPSFWYTQAAIMAVLLLLALWATAISGDLRWTLAATLFMTVDQFSLAPLWASVHLPGRYMSHVTLTGLATLAALLLIMGLFARRARRTLSE